VYFNGGMFDAFDASPLRGLPANAVAGDYGLYILTRRSCGGATPGKTGIFAAFNWAPDQRVNPVPYFFDTGMVAYGLLPSRPRDFAGFGVVYGSYSGDLQRAEMVRALANPSISVQDYETTLELTCGCALRSGLHLQPDFQYIIHPGGIGPSRTQWRFGVNLVANF
jgi:porin